MRHISLSLYLICILVTAITAPNLQAQPLVIKFATANPQGSHYVAHLMKFKQLVESYSHRTILVDAIIDGRYGSEHDNVMGTAEGDIQMSTVAVNNLTPFAPSVGFLSLPYLFDNETQARTLFRHPIMSEVNSKMVEQANVRALGWMIGGFRVLTNNKRPVYQPSDLAGLKIRTPMNPIMVATFRSWGIEPLPIAWTETYAALEMGTVDGQENPHITYSAMPNANGHIYKVQKYITDIHYILWTGPHLINEDFYLSLTSEQRQILHRAADEAALYQWQWIAEQNSKQLQRLLDQGMVLLEPANEEQLWKAKAISIWPQFLGPEEHGFLQRIEAIIRD
ncbi:MAG: TRAP transporter substrate-binding protein [Motiliproteus sp.]